MKLIYCFAASAALHAALFALPPVPPAGEEETVVPVALVAAPANPPRAASSATTPRKLLPRKERIGRNDPSRAQSEAAARNGPSAALSERADEPALTALNAEPTRSDISPRWAARETSGREGERGEASSSPWGDEPPAPRRETSAENRTAGGNDVPRVYKGASYAYSPAPRYPERARRRGWQGTVLLNVLIARSGKPAQVEIQQSSGFEILDNAALQAVKKWSFHPAAYGDSALEAWVKVPIVFRLNDKDQEEQ